MRAQPRFMVLAGIGVLIGLGFCALCFPGLIERAEGRGGVSSRPSLAHASKVEGDLLATQRARFVETYGKLPLSFELNRGQTVDPVRFLVRGQGYSMFLTGNEAVLALQGESQKADGKGQKAKMSEPARVFARSLLPPPVAILQGTTHNQQPTTHDFPIDNLQSSIDNFLAPSTLRLRLVNANPDAKVVGLEPLSGKSNYFMGRDPTKWRTNIPNYRKVKYESVYPGIDLVYYGNQGRVEHDFIVAPGADPHTIAFEVATPLTPRPSPNGRGWPGGQGEGSPVRIDSNGDLVIPTDAGEVRLEKPVVYQPVAAIYDRRNGNIKIGDGTSPLQPNPKPKIENPKFVDGRFLLRPAKSETGNSKLETGSSPDTRHLAPETSFEVAFELGPYDKSRPLVIDPVLTYSIQFPGMIASSSNGGYDIAMDQGGSAYLAGWTIAVGYPTSSGTSLILAGGNSDAFIIKLGPAGTPAEYSAFIGGSGRDQAESIAVDSSGQAYVTGYTQSTDFPTTAGVFQTSSGDPTTDYYGDVFVTKLNPSGSALAYSTYLGESIHQHYPDEACCNATIALDSGGNAYVTGRTSSSDFPTTPGAFDTSFDSPLGSFVAFVSKLNSDATALVYSTFLGDGSSPIATGIAVDATGNAYVGGWAGDGFPTTPGAVQPNLAGGVSDAFVTKLNPDGSDLVYSTYLGGTEGEVATDIAVDGVGNAYLGGSPSSANFPTTPGALQETCTISPCSFVAKFNATGAQLVYSTFVPGGSFFFPGFGLAVNDLGEVYVTAGESANFPFVYPVLTSGGSTLSKISASGSTLLFSSFVHADSRSSANAVAIDSAGDASIVGYCCRGSNTTSGTFAAKVSGLNLLPGISFSPRQLAFPAQLIGTTSSQKAVTITSEGDASLVINDIATTGPFILDHDCPVSPAVLPSGATCTVDISFAPATRGASTGAIEITDNFWGSPHTISLTGTATGPVVAFSSPSLTFGGQIVASTSTPQEVTLYNTGDGPMTISNIVTSGDFAQTNNCPISPQTLPVATSCNINVTFTPTGSSTRSGNLSIIDNAENSPQAVALSGTGQDYTLSADPTERSIAPGAGTTYALSVLPAGGFNQPVALVCTGAPARATCSLNPSSVTPDGANAAPVTVNVTTTAPSVAGPGPRLTSPRPWAPASPWRLPFWVWLMALTLLVALALERGRRWASLRRTALAGAMLIVLLWVACGGGGGTTVRQPSGGTPAGTYSLTVTATSGNLSRSITLILRVT